MAAPNSHFKVSGAWKRVRNIYVKNLGVWKRVKNVYVKVSGAWKKVYSYYPGPGSTSYTTPGTYTFTATFDGAYTFTIDGAGGSGSVVYYGSIAWWSTESQVWQVGHFSTGGGSGARRTITLNLVYGQQVTIVVGAGGAGVGSGGGYGSWSKPGNSGEASYITASGISYVAGGGGGGQIATNTGGAAGTAYGGVGGTFTNGIAGGVQTPVDPQFSAEPLSGSGAASPSGAAAQPGRRGSYNYAPAPYVNWSENGPAGNLYGGGSAGWWNPNNSANVSGGGSNGRVTVSW